MIMCSALEIQKYWVVLVGDVVGAAFASVWPDCHGVRSSFAANGDEEQLSAVEKKEKTKLSNGTSMRMRIDDGAADIPFDIGFAGAAHGFVAAVEFVVVAFVAFAAVASVAVAFAIGPVAAPVAFAFVGFAAFAAAFDGFAGFVGVGFVAFAVGSDFVVAAADEFGFVAGVFYYFRWFCCYLLGRLPLGILVSDMEWHSRQTHRMWAMDLR